MQTELTKKYVWVILIKRDEFYEQRKGERLPSQPLIVKVIESLY